jgi:hypothetical protein
MSAMGNFVVEVQERVYGLIEDGVDVDKVYEIIRSEYGEMGVGLVANCYFEDVYDGAPV